MGEKCVLALLLVHILMFVFSFVEVIECLTSFRENESVFGLSLGLYLMATFHPGQPVPSTSNICLDELKNTDIHTLYLLAGTLVFYFSTQVQA